MFESYTFFETASMSSLSSPLDLHKELKRKNVETCRNNKMVIASSLSPMGEVALDLQEWLPFAAKPYQISGKVADYILVPVFTIPSDIPNRNGVSFPLHRMVEFNTESGSLAYKAFKGKPVHLEHDNQDPLKAKGVIVDASLRKMKGYGEGKIWKLIKLLAVDRTKDPILANAILTGEMNSYSMGAMVSGYECGMCKKDIGQCSHISIKEMKEVIFRKHGNNLVFKRVKSFFPIETSCVSTPAWSMAVSDKLMPWS